MIDLARETPLSLNQACASLPPARGDRLVHKSCLVRWILNGVRGPGGELVRLEAARVGNRWVTSKEALQRFAEALTPRLGDAPAPPRTPGKRQRASERAALELEKAGI